MSGKQYELGIQISGDGSVFVREAARAEKAAIKLGETVGGVEKSARGLGDGAARAAAGLEAAQSRTAGASRTLGSGLQNTSYQLQDFIVQVNGGVDATHALGMQLPQLLGGFGAAGAAIGVVAALLPNLVSAFAGSTAGAKDFDGAMSDFGKAVGDVGKATREFDMEKLYEQFNKSSDVVRAATIEQLNFQQEYIKTQQLVAGKKFGESLSDIGMPGLFSGRKSATEILAKDLGVTLDLALKLQPALNGLRDGTGSVNAVFEQFGTKLLGGNAKAIELAATMSDLAKAERDSAAAASAISEAQAKMAKGHVQTKKEAEEAKKAREDAAKAAEREAKALDSLLDSINGKDSGLDTNYIQNVESLLKAYGKGKLSLEQFNEVFARYVAMQPGAVAAAREASKAEADYQKALSSGSADLERRAGQLEREAEYYGLTEPEIQRTIVARLEEARAIAAANGAYPEHLAYLDREIDARKRIAAAAANKESLDASKRAVDEQARAWDNFARDIERSLTDSLYRGLEKGGKDGAKLARDTITNSLKAIPLKLFVQAVINPVMNGAQQALGIGAGSGTAGSVGSLASLYNAYSSWSNAGGVGGLGTTAGNWFGQAFGDAAYVANSGAYAQGFSAGLYGGQGMAAEYSKYALEMSNSGNYAAAGAYQQAADAAGQGAAQGSSLSSGLGYAAAVYALTQGQYGQAVGTAIGTAIMPGIGTAIGSTLGGLVDSFTSSGGASKSMVGGGGRITASGVDYNVAGLPHWTDYTAQSQQLASSIVTDQLVTALHKINAGYTGSAYFKGEINSKGSSSNQTLAQATNAAGQVVYHRFVEDGKGPEDFQRAAAAEIPKLQLALMVDAMRSAGGEIKHIADSVVGTTGDLTAALSGMDSAAVAATTANLSGLAGVFEQLQATIPGMTGEVAVSMAKMAGGAQALVSASAAYSDAVLSDSEKQALAWSQLERSFTALQMPVARTTDELEKLVDAQDVATEAGQRMKLSLMALAPALKNLTTAAEQQRQQLQGRIDELTGNTAAIRARELAALEPSNRALQERIWAIEAEATAAQKAAEVANQRAGLQTTLDQMLGNTAAIRARELAALEPSNRALQERIWAIEDERTAVEASKAAQESAKAAAQTAYGRLQEAVNAQKQGYSATLNAEKESIQARLKAQQDAGRAQIDAARATADSIRSIAGSLKSAIKAAEIDSPQHNFARLTSARDLIRRAGETGDLKLPGLEDALQLATGDNKQFYARFEDYAFAQATTGAVIDDLYSRASAQLSTQESIVSALEAQMSSAQTIADAQIAAAEEAYRQQDDALAATLAQGQSQLNALLGIDGRVLSVADAVQALGAAISAAQSAQSAALAAAQAQTQAALQAAAQKSTAAGGGAASPSGNWWDGGGWVDSSSTWHPNVENSPWYGSVDSAMLSGIFGGNIPNTATSHAYGGALTVADWQAVKAAADPAAAYRDLFRDRVGATVADWAAGGESGAAVKDQSGGIISVLVGNSAQEVAQGTMNYYGVGAAGTALGSAAASEIVASAIGQYGAGAEAAGQQIYAQAQALGLSTASIAAATGQTVQSIQEWIEARGLEALDGSHASGLNYVPFDGYRAELHEGEAVVSAPEVRAIRRYFGAAAGGSGQSNAELAEALRRIADRLDAIETNTRAGAAHAAGTKRNLDRVTRGAKLSVTVEAAA